MTSRTFNDPRVTAGQPIERLDVLRLCLLLIFTIMVMLGGGASGGDVLSLLYLYPGCVIVGVLLLLTSSGGGAVFASKPLLFLGCLAAIMIIQLVPMPPWAWLSLPGHERFGPLAEVAKIEQPWRPISVAPDLTLSSLVSLVVPAVALVGLAALRRRWDMLVLGTLVLAALISAVLGVLQVAGGSSFYLYAVTNQGSPVGLFANRNHQAILLACAFPLAAAWAVAGQVQGSWSGGRRVAVGVLGAFFVPMIVLTGSRAGLLLGLVGLTTAFYILRSGARKDGNSRLRKLLELLPWAVAGVLIIAALALARAPAIQRLLTSRLEDESRFTDLTLLAEIAKEFFPLGSGFGTFDRVFRMYEPTDYLGFTYLNHAHNDLLELLITAGVPGALLLVVFLFWFLHRTLPIVRSPVGAPNRVIGVAAASVIVILLVASFFEYPLRTPFMMMLFAVCSWWVSEQSRTSRALLQPSRQAALY